jgi:hypothetical protein
MASDLLNKLMGNAGLSNKENVEKARQELAGAITRVVINEALSEAKMRAQERDKMLIKPKGEKP